MIPNKKQWQSWSLPSKYTALGFLLSIIGLLGMLYQFAIPDGRTEIIAEFKGAFKEIKQENEVKNAYMDRYLKKRIAVIQDMRAMPYKESVLVRLYYESYWEGLTSTFLAAVEVRKIDDLNKKYFVDEGWEFASLLTDEGLKDSSIYLGSSKYVIVDNLLEGVTYELRIVDHNYDSDEPPSKPYRFMMGQSK